MTVSKHGMGYPPPTVFNDRKSLASPMKGKLSSFQVLRAFILLALPLASLACVIPVLGPSEPVYTPPMAQAYITATSDPALFTLTPPTPSVTSIPISPTHQSTLTTTPPKMYYTQAGDTLWAVAIRFGVEIEEIKTSPEEEMPQNVLLSPNQLLIIPNQLINTTSPMHLMPDSEVVFSASAIDFDINTFVQEAGGYLSTYYEHLASGKTSGADVVYRIAIENSINPRLLLALLEYESGWVYGEPKDMAFTDYPLGHVDLRDKGLYHQLSWAVNKLSIGYYGWREGLLTEIEFSDGVKARLAPELNAGTVALQYYLAQVNDSAGWLQALDVDKGLPALHERMFGNPWLRAQAVEPIFPPDLQQPHLTLPFLIGQMWSYTGGPHGAWERDGARAALDFAPGGTESGCVPSNAWIIASAPGLVTRTGNGFLVTDLDGDGHEQTGWVLLYLHVKDMKVKVGDLIEAGEMLGHPSCEGGIATGTHLHIARKYNGEWIPAAGPVPFVMGGWVPHAGEKPYKGTLTRDEQTIYASQVGAYESRIIRGRDDP